eukprot:Skav202444  [mRNA]  locus=scaffold5808:33996:38725:- [translate_table: standard]
MRFARLARALRGVRVIRLLRYIGALRTIVRLAVVPRSFQLVDEFESLRFSIVSTMSSLLWTLVLLVMNIYCFGVFITQLVTDHCRYLADDADAKCPVALTKWWASVGDSRLDEAAGGSKSQESRMPLL